MRAVRPLNAPLLLIAVIWLVVKSLRKRSMSKHNEHDDTRMMKVGWGVIGACRFTGGGEGEARGGFSKGKSGGGRGGGVDRLLRVRGQLLR